MYGLKAAAIGGVLLIMMASPALAFQCSSLVAKVDAALADASNLSTDQADDIKALRDDGAARHEAGDHGGAVAVLEEALTMLGQSGGGSSTSGRGDY